MKLQCITPTIQVTDLEEAISWYEDIGFAKDWMWPEKNSTHASVSWNGVNFMMVQVSPSSAIQRADLYFTLDNVREYHEWLRIKKDIPGLVQSPYGMLDFSIQDPWGHHLTFGTAEGEFKE